MKIFMYSMRNGQGSRYIFPSSYQFSKRSRLTRFSQNRITILDYILMGILTTDSRQIFFMHTLIHLQEGKLTRMYIPGKGVEISPESITRLAKNVKIVELRVEVSLKS